MKLPKIIALLLIIGLSLQSAACPQMPKISAADNLEELTRMRTGPSLQGGEQNIDPFTVHPANRWDSADSGSFEETLENGELSWKGFINDSASMNRWRSAGTVDDTISNRWRLNATADFATNQTDVFISQADYGPDGFGWEEGTQEGWTQANGDGINFAVWDTANTLHVWDVTGAANFWALSPNTLSFSADLYTHLETRIYMTNNTDDKSLIIFDQGAVVSYGGTTLTFGWNTIVLDLSADPDWTGTITNFMLVVTDRCHIYVDYCRIVADNEYPGDFEIPLSGFNATTAEGTANITLNAYPWNSSHYVVRPAFTTNDGDNWRSWNLESDYQDYAQMQGEWGADGWEFLEGKDGWEEGEGIDFTTTGFERGLWNGTITINEAFVNIIVDIDAGADLAIYDSVDIKIRSNASIIKHNLVGYWDGDFKTMNSTDVNINGSWQIINIPYTRTETTLKLGITLKDEAGNFEGDETVFIDYVKLLTTTDTDDLTFYDYETYYRSELEYNLRKSELSFLLLDDLGDDLAEAELGEFSIANFFETDELIPDGFQGEVGHIDYLFGGRTAGANATITWDYYEAEFAEFNFDLFLLTENGGDTWDSESPFASYSNSTAGGVHPANQVLVAYELTVPEFDSCSGTFALSETLSNSLPVTSVGIQTVNRSDGERNAAVSVQLTGGHFDVAVPTYDSAHEIIPQLGLVQQATYLQDMTDNRSSEMSFSMYMDKILRKIHLQVSFVNASGNSIVLAYVYDMLPDASNEMVITIGMAINWLDANPGEAHIILNDWSLKFRDLFGGIPNPVDIIDDVVGGGGSGGILGGAFDTLIQPLIAILNGIVALPDAIGRIFTVVGNAIVSAVSTLGTTITNGLTTLGTTITNGLTTLGTTITNAVTAIGTQITNAVTAIGTVISDAVTAIGTQISNAVDAIGTVITAAIEAMELAIETAISSLEDAVDLVTDAVDLVTAAVAALAGQIITALTDALSDIVEDILDLLGTIWTAIVTFIRDQSIQGVTVGSVFDVIFSYVALFTATAATTLAFLLMIVTEWSLIAMVFLFLIILFVSIAGANAPGEVFGNVFNAYKINTLPFSVLGFRMHVPLAAWNLPFLAIVVLGIA